MRYAVEGKLVSPSEYHNASLGQYGCYTTVYRNNAARDRFGKDVWEVVDLNFNRKDLHISFDFDENGDVSAYIGNNATAKSTDDEIRAQVTSVLEYNRARGETTRIEAHSSVPERYNDMIDQWMDRLIDRSAPDIRYHFQKTQRSIVIVSDVQKLPKNVKTIFSQDKVVDRSDNQRSMNRTVSVKSNDDGTENTKPNRVHIDEYDNMFLIIDQPTENADIREIIKELPGVSVNDQGQVTANGTTVRKVYLNGEEISL